MIPINMCVIDFSLPVTMELPIMFIFSSILGMLIEARNTRKTMDMNQTKTVISEMCKICLQKKKKKATTGALNSLLLLLKRLSKQRAACLPTRQCLARLSAPAALHFFNMLSNLATV